MCLRVREVYTDVDGGDEEYVFGETDWYEPFTDDRGELFRSCQQMYGRCAGTVYKDVRKAIAFYPPVLYTYWNGWTFLKRRKYQDSDETYLQRTWVIVEGADEADALVEVNYG